MTGFFNEKMADPQIVWKFIGVRQGRKSRAADWMQIVRCRSALEIFSCIDHFLW
jgi:hypothetical protein